MTFVFCCALPTLATLAIIVLTWTPWWHRRALARLEASLSRDTGLVLRIDDYRRAAPSTLCLLGVGVFDPETGREVARAREVQWKNAGDEILIVLKQPELQSAELSNAWKMIHDRFLCRPDRTSLPIQLVANDLTIQSQLVPLPFVDVDAWIRPRIGSQAIEATIRGLPANGSWNVNPSARSPITINVVRDRSDPVPRTSWTLSTGKTPLPCSTLADYLPPLGRLGEDATFSGKMRWTVMPDGWSVDLGDSRFQGIVLSQWLEDLPHRLTGTATVELERCRLVTEKREVKVVDVAGTLRARDGQVGPSMLAAVRRHLGFAVVEVQRSIAYDRLALGFNLNGPRLQLQGQCRSEIGYEGLAEGVVLCAGGYSLVESSGEHLQAVQLQSALAPEHSVTVPLSRQTSPLLNFLMPPNRLPAPGESATTPRISTSREWSGGETIQQPRVE
jgi:hypothetical protein